VSAKERYSLSAEAVGRLTGLCGATIRGYAAHRYIDHARTRTGRFLFKRSVVPRVLAVYALRQQTIGRPLWRKRVLPEVNEDFDSAEVAQIVQDLADRGGL